VETGETPKAKVEANTKPDLLLKRKLKNSIE
jgi:hypothetical protein